MILSMAIECKFMTCMMIERAVVQFRTCIKATVQFRIFLSDQVTHLYLLFNIATVFLWNFVNEQFLNELQKCYTLYENFAYLRKLFCQFNKCFFLFPPQIFSLM